MLDFLFGLLSPKPKPPRPSIVAVLARFNRPFVLRLFGAINAGAALFYGGLATYGLIITMFPGIGGVAPPAYGITEMVLLMERSATHTALAGLAFAIDFVTKAAAIVQTRHELDADPTPKPAKADK